MDVGTTNGWRMDDVVPAAQILATINQRWPLEPLEASYPGDVASRYRYRDGVSEIGLIASVTQPFCVACTRARLSADGKRYACMFATRGHDLRGPLRDGLSDEQLQARLGSIWAKRADRYSETRHPHTTRRGKIEMSYVGG
jgi:cyclic pyranopterin phosphate synthase